MIFHWSLSDSKSPQVPRTLLIILTDLNDSLVWIVSTRLFISNSSSPCTNPLLTIPRVSITIGITIIFMFHSFFNSLASSKCFLSILLCGQPGQKSPKFGKLSVLGLGFFFIDLVVWPRLDDPFESQNPSVVCASHSLGQILGCTYTICSLSNFNFLHSSRWITLPTQSCLVLYSFCANLLHSLIIWLVISSYITYILLLLYLLLLLLLILVAVVS